MSGYLDKPNIDGYWFVHNGEKWCVVQVHTDCQFCVVRCYEWVTEELIKHYNYQKWLPVEMPPHPVESEEEKPSAVYQDTPPTTGIYWVWKMGDKRWTTCFFDDSSGYCELECHKLLLINMGRAKWVPKLSLISPPPVSPHLFADESEWLVFPDKAGTYCVEYEGKVDVNELFFEGNWKAKRPNGEIKMATNQGELMKIIERPNRGGWWLALSAQKVWTPIRVWDDLVSADIIGDFGVWAIAVLINNGFTQWVAMELPGEDPSKNPPLSDPDHDGYWWRKTGSDWQCVRVNKQSCLFVGDNRLYEVNAKIHQEWIKVKEPSEKLEYGLKELGESRPIYLDKPTETGYYWNLNKDQNRWYLWFYNNTTKICTFDNGSEILLSNFRTNEWVKIEPGNPPPPPSATPQPPARTVTAKPEEWLVCPTRAGFYYVEWHNRETELVELFYERGWKIRYRHDEVAAMPTLVRWLPA